MADLEDCASFAAYADEIVEVFANADVIVGYNLSFDIDMLQAEYAADRQADARPHRQEDRRCVPAVAAVRAAQPAARAPPVRRRRVRGRAQRERRRRRDRPRAGRHAARTSSSPARTGARSRRVCDPQPRELGRSVAPPALGRRGDRARLRQAHGHAAARARGGPRPQLPALGDREGLPAARRRDLPRGARAQRRGAGRVGAPALRPAGADAQPPFRK